MTGTTWQSQGILVVAGEPHTFELIEANVLDLGETTASRRAHTLMTWYETLIPYHYDAPPSG
jgi:hypothetical protein